MSAAALDLDTEDARRVGLAVLAQSAHDLGARDPETQRSAVVFLAGRRSRWLVEALGLDPEAVRGRAFARLADSLGKGEARRLWRSAMGPSARKGTA